ncbi:MAG: hypothetical protein ACP5DC_01200 [Halothiobacillaceae bacterium]
MTDCWKRRSRPAMMEGKFLFDGYESLRDFLDRVAEVNDGPKVEMNISFGRDHASLVVYPRGEDFSDEELSVTAEIEALYREVSGGRIIDSHAGGGDSA